jgi:membrane peptidoglycan carboxypeptidase
MAARIALFVVASLFAGILAAGLALPAIGFAGLSAKNAAQSFEALPAELQTPALDQRTRILAANGQTIATFYSENRVYVPLTKIAPVMQQAIVAIEDSRFYQHGGIDLRGTLRALLTNAESGGVTQGGSTLTQQYVKNVLVMTAKTKAEQEAATARSFSRKIREARLALGLEQQETKDQILEGYLNIAYFGAGAYGVEAAAQRYFSKPAADLTLPEAATLAGIVQYPSAFDAIAHTRASQDRRNVVLQRMADVGDISQAQADAAAARPLKSMLRPNDAPNGCTSSVAPWFCDYVYRTMLSDPAYGATLKDREALIREGGLVVRTTLDLFDQRHAQLAVDAGVHPKDPSRVGDAIVMVQPGTGQILAMAQNHSYGTNRHELGVTAYNYSVDAAYGGTNGMQAGSTFKAFTLAAALAKGIPMDESITAPAQGDYTTGDFTDCSGNPVPIYPPWTPVNSTISGTNTLTMRYGTAWSVNTFFTELERQVGLCDVVRTAEKLGVHSATGAPMGLPASFTLGSPEVSPLTVANAYATLAARGRYCNPIVVTSVTQHGKSLPVPSADCHQAIAPSVADGVNNLLAGVIDGPIPGRTGGSESLGRPAAGKTGTTDNNAEVWFAGYTPNLAAAVWVGDPRGNGPSHDLVNLTINGSYVARAYGGLFAGPIWKSAMLAALSRLPVEYFTPPSPSLLYGAQVIVPDVRGKTAAEAKTLLAAAGFQVTVSSTRVDSTYPAGTVAKTSPETGTTTTAGTVVTLYLSTGIAPSPSSSPTPTTSASPSGSPTSGSPSPSPSPTKH